MNNFKIAPFKKIIDITDIPNRDHYKNIHLDVKAKKPFHYCITNESGLTNEIKYQQTQENQLTKYIPQNSESIFLILKSCNNEVLDASISISGKDVKPSKQFQWIFQYCTFYNIFLLLLCIFFIYYMIRILLCKSSQKSFEKGPFLSYVTPPINNIEVSPNIPINPISDT